MEYISSPVLIIGSNDGPFSMQETSKGFIILQYTATTIALNR